MAKIISKAFAAAMRRINDVLVRIPLLNIDVELKNVASVTLNDFDEETITYDDPIETTALIRNVRDRKLLRSYGLLKEEGPGIGTPEVMLAHFKYIDDVQKGAKFKSIRNNIDDTTITEYYKVVDVLVSSRINEVKRIYVIDFDKEEVW